MLSLGGVPRNFSRMLSPPILKPREREILQLIAQGLTDRAIGSRLQLAPETVRWYNKQLYAKLQVSSREDAARVASVLGLLDAADTRDVRPSVARSPIRYVNNDGVSIAYQTVGAGPVDLVFIAGFVSHLELSWEEPGYATFFDAIGRHARVILFDKRGAGLSDRAHGASTIEQTISDARAVMRAVASRRAFVSGTSEGGAAAVLLASTYPDEVRGLVLIASTPMVSRVGNEPAWSHPRAEFQARITRIAETWGDPWTLERFAPSRCGDPVFEEWWTRTLRSASSPASVRLTMQQSMQVDIRALLPQVRTRALIVHRIDDPVVNVGAARYFAARMPNASLVELPGADHIYFVDPLPIANALVRFLAEPDVEPQIESWIAIVLEAAGPGALLTDEKRQLLATMDARHLRTTANGWMALFDAPNRALRCAERMRALGSGRCGGMALHVGACRTSDGTPIGFAHELAHRLVHAAAPGEVLVSGTLRDILAGSNVGLVARSIDGGDNDTPPMTVWQLERQAPDRQ